VYPDLVLVVVFTRENYVGEEPAGETITRFVLPAVQ